MNAICCDGGVCILKAGDMGALICEITPAAAPAPPPPLPPPPASGGFDAEGARFLTLKGKGAEAEAMRFMMVWRD